MLCTVRPIIVTFIFVSVFVSANSQLYAGGGIGMLNIPGADLRCYGPNLKIEYTPDNGPYSFYWDASYCTTAVPAGNTDIYSNIGRLIGSAATTKHYKYLYNQVGFKALLAGDADEQKIMPFLGGGLDVVVATAVWTYKSDNYHIDDDVARTVLYGMHFHGGVQYNLQPVILELKGTIDLVLKPLAGGISNLAGTIRLSAIIPITN